MLRERQFGILLTRSGLHLAVILPFTSSMVNFIHKKSHFIQLHKKCAPPQKYYLGLSEIRSCNFSNNKFCHRCFLRKLAGFKTIVLLEKGLNYWHFDCDFLKMQAATWLKLEIFCFVFLPLILSKIDPTFQSYMGSFQIEKCSVIWNIIHQRCFLEKLPKLQLNTLKHVISITFPLKAVL